MQTKKILTAALITGALFTAIATPSLAGLLIEGRFQTICNTIDTPARGSDVNNDLQIWSYATLDDIPSARTTDGDIYLWSTNTYKLLEATACHILKIRDTLGKRQAGDRTVLDYVKGTSRDVGAQTAQLDQINRNILRVLDQSSNGTTCVGADARRSATTPVAGTTISQCTSRCIATLNQNTGEMAGDNINTERSFAQCIVRCSSNTGNNYECARRYLDLLGGLTPQELAEADAQNGRAAGLAATNFINRCLSTPTYLDCHRGCDGSGSVARHNACVSRCSGMNGFGEAMQSVVNNENIDENVRVMMMEGGWNEGAGDNTRLMEPLNESGKTLLLPSTDNFMQTPFLNNTPDISACTNRCQTDRLNCIKASATQKDLENCTAANNTCQSACSSVK